MYCGRMLINLVTHTCVHNHRLNELQGKYYEAYVRAVDPERRELVACYPPEYNLGQACFKLSYDILMLAVRSFKYLGEVQLLVSRILSSWSYAERKMHDDVRWQNVLPNIFYCNLFPYSEPLLLRIKNVAYLKFPIYIFGRLSPLSSSLVLGWIH